MKNTAGFGTLRTRDQERRSTRWDTHQFYVTLNEAHGEKAVSGPACACAVRVRLLDGDSQVRVRGGPALEFKRSPR